MAPIKATPLRRRSAASPSSRQKRSASKLPSTPRTQLLPKAKIAEHGDAHALLRSTMFKPAVICTVVAVAVFLYMSIRNRSSCPPIPEGSVVLLTGASSGIGAELAVQLGARGVHLVIAARRATELAGVADAAAAAGAASVLAIPTDMSDSIAISKLVEDTVARYGKINVLLLNHAAVDEGLIVGYGSTAALEAALSVPLRANTIGSALAAAAALPALEVGRGHIAIVSSASAKVPAPFRAGYVASKAALGGLFGVLSAELHLLKSPVTVGVLILGMVATAPVTRDAAAAAIAAPVGEVAAEMLCAIGRRDAEAYVPWWYRYWTYITQIGGPTFAEWAMNEAYIFKVPRFVEAIERYAFRAAE